MKPIDWSREKAFRRTEDGCLSWRGLHSSKGQPIIYIQRDGHSRPISVRRSIMQMVVGRRLRWEEKVMDTCGNPSCCNRKHLIVTDASTVLRAALAKHNWNADPIRNAKIARSTKRLYTPEQADDMRRRYEAGESWGSITEAYKAPPSTLRRILQYTGYTAHLPPNIVYALRQAAA